jgi:hypothetical protein
MGRKPRQRRSKVHIDEKLVALFRAAMPAHMMLRKASRSGKYPPLEEQEAALAAIRAFDLASGRRLWEFSALEGFMAGPGTLRNALMTLVTEKEWKTWERFARRYEQIDLTVNPSPAMRLALEYLEECARDV